MAIAIKPLRRRRRTAQRGKPMSQSQRWGKVVITMAVPNGAITTSEILVPEVVPLDQAIAEADAEVGAEELEIEDDK
jgi:hypothetical protein